MKFFILKQKEKGHGRKVFHYLIFLSIIFLLSSSLASGLVIGNNSINGVVVGNVPPSNISLQNVNSSQYIGNVPASTVEAGVKFWYNQTSVSSNSNLSLSDSLILPLSNNSRVGVIYKNTFPFIHDYASNRSMGHNVFIGKSSGNFTLDPNSTDPSDADLSSFNTCVGDECMQKISTAQNNVCIGYQCLQKVTTGHRNNAVGYTALYALTTGETNEAMGDAALGRLTTGEDNVGIGYVSGYRLVNGSGNIFIGYGSGFGTNETRSPVTDNFGILIGFVANRGVVNTTQLTNYIGIGTAVEINKSGQIRIGSSSYNETILRANVGIGVENPLQPLVVGRSGTSAVVNFTRTDASAGWSMDFTNSNPNYRSSAQHIFFVGSTEAFRIQAGSTGVRNNNPQFTFDVNGSSRSSGNITISNLAIISASNQVVCGTSTAGAIYYNSTTATHYGCNSSDWRALY